MLRLRSQGLGAVRTYGAIPPMPMAWVPPVYEATGGYAAPSPCLSPALTIALHFCFAFMFCIFVLRLFSHLSCAFKFCIFVLQIGKFFIFGLLLLVFLNMWLWMLRLRSQGLRAVCTCGAIPPMLRMGPSRLRSHGWLRCPKPLPLSGFDDRFAVMFCIYVSHLSSAFLFSRLVSSSF